MGLSSTAETKEALARRFLAAIPDSAIDPCVHCGFCLTSCASYRVTGSEMDSPRGRLHLLRGVEAASLELADVAEHFESCLGCFACVTACPAGVRYDQVISAVRPALRQTGHRSPWQQAFRQALFSLLPYPDRLRPLLRPLQAYAGGPLQRLARRTGLTALFGPEIEAMERLLPPLAIEAFRDGLPPLVPAQGQRRYRVGLVLGCVQRVFDPTVNHAAARVLAANGIEVVVPPGQTCCGAMTAHQGEDAHTEALARALIDCFAAAIGPAAPGGPDPLDAVLVAASGCGHTLKLYDRILARDPVWAERATGFASQVLDVQEFLHRVGLAAPLRPLRQAPLRAVFHDACHMLHGQGIAAQPRELLQEIPGLSLVEATDAGLCCGSAGIYNVVQPREAAELGAMKAADLASSGADIAVSANIGCSLQIRRHMGDQPQPLPVYHPLQLLDWSLRGETLPSA
ncbi:MAG: (Fe-S)-binding protein [Aphanocapsa feldmannii 277cV]|uniref:Glycolate oxidase iron-sulfur subunit n=2 Tax=Aphanocapsa feldmannii TaxID=192050 RepID=A0A524RPW1_9CHRO|nr:MAG: (Fe-S)-binding protein [Aphanocapsa feldmannii 277cV]TGH21193.1 MAG: (Fe-S)-binding protein [Aphanocapsa feldmannii 277cI]